MLYDDVEKEFGTGVLKDDGVLRTWVCTVSSFAGRCCIFAETAAKPGESG
jgi:hypothetical protein